MVAAAAKEAVMKLRSKGSKVGLFRPITINPFDTRRLKQALARVKVAHIFESSLNQLARIIKYESYGLSTPLIEHPKPAEGFTSDEIISQISRTM